MARKVLLIADPGIDGAFAVALAVQDPRLEVLGLAAAAGNVNADQATRNVHILIEQLDPPRWPRLGAALPVAQELSSGGLHGRGGLGGVDFPCAELHHPHPSDKLISDLVRLHPKEVAIILMAPATTFARALDRDPELAGLVERLVILGGAWREPGDAGPVSEFHFAFDPVAARQVLRAGIPTTLLPLDVTRKLVFSPTDLLHLPAPETRTTRFLQRIVPHGIGSSSSLYGTEGFHLQDVLGVAAASHPGLLKTKPFHVDVEIRGELTRGMSVFDARWACSYKPNVEAAVEVDVPAVRRYVAEVLEHAGEAPPGGEPAE
jgi:inosine-uridine nucleoside N-ribohydrolase